MSASDGKGKGRYGGGSLTLRQSSSGRLVNGSFFSSGLTNWWTKLSCWLVHRLSKSARIRLLWGAVLLLKCCRTLARKKSSSSAASLQSGWMLEGPGEAAGVGGGGGDPVIAWPKSAAGVLMLGVGGPRGGRGCGIFMAAVFKLSSSQLKTLPLLSEKLSGLLYPVIASKALPEALESDF